MKRILALGFVCLMAFPQTVDAQEDCVSGCNSGLARLDALTETLLTTGWALCDREHPYGSNALTNCYTTEYNTYESNISGNIGAWSQCVHSCTTVFV